MHRIFFSRLSVSPAIQPVASTWRNAPPTDVLPEGSGGVILKPHAISTGLRHPAKFVNRAPATQISSATKSPPKRKEFQWK
jgi:hypothetical protein